MANTIKIKYSTETPIPPDLAIGEVAWSKATQRLYIGEDDGTITAVTMPLDPADIEAIAAQVDAFHGHFSVLNGNQAAVQYLLDPELTANALNTWASDPVNLNQLRILLHIPVFVSALLIDDVARLALFAADALVAPLLIQSPDAFGLLAKSQSAMQVLWAQNTTTDQIWTNPLARIAVWQSDAALAALQANPEQIQRKISAGAVSTAMSGATTFTFAPLGRKTLLLRRYFTGASNAAEWLTWGREGVGDALLPTGVFLNSGSSAAKGRTTTYANSGIYPSASNDNANCVCATNGLARGGSTVASTLYVIYLLV